MKAIANLQVKSCTQMVSYSCSSLEDQHISLTVCMTDKQLKKAIVALLGTLPASQIHDLLMEEFPTVMQEE